MNLNFGPGPVTVEILRKTGGPEVWIANEVYWEPGTPIALIISGRSEERLFQLDSLTEVAPKRWEGNIYQQGPKVVVRPTVESDAMSSVTMYGAPSVSMPLPVLADLHADNQGVLTMPTLYALYEEDGFVATMLLNSDVGLYLRYSGAWHLLTDPNTIDGLFFMEVEGPALDMFDQFDRAGQLVPVSSMPGYRAEPTYNQTGENAPVESDATDVTAEGTVAASAGTDSLVINDLDDVPAAIQAALANPDLQWWVERRVKARGFEVELPWVA